MFIGLLLHGMSLHGARNGAGFRPIRKGSSKYLNMQRLMHRTPPRPASNQGLPTVTLCTENKRDPDNRERAIPGAGVIDRVFDCQARPCPAFPAGAQ
jgi:hypothetical protein